MTVEKLLDQMRPRVELLLEQCAGLFDMPTCVSQHHRTVFALAQIDSKIREIKGLTQEKLTMMRISTRLREFDHVWSAVNILEYPGNHAWIEEPLPGPQLSVSE